MRIFLYLLFGIISFGAGTWAAGGVYQCIPCPAGIDCPAGTNEVDIAEEVAAQDTSLGVPVGTIIALAKSKGDEFGGYLLCNGQDIPIGTKYNALRDFLGDTYGAGKVPNFQGHFLRGVGGNAAAAGTEQGDAIRNITGEWNAGAHHSHIGASGVFTSWSNSSYEFSTSTNGGRVRFDASYVVPTAAENRPVNYAVYYYIKY